MKAKATQIFVAAVIAVGAGQAALADEAIPPNTPIHVYGDAPGRGWQQRPFASVPTRSAVLADLQIYRESGLAELNQGESVQWYSPRYAEAQAKYAQLRASPYYATLVQRIAERRGEQVTLVGG